MTKPKKHAKDSKSTEQPKERSSKNLEIRKTTPRLPKKVVEAYAKLLNSGEDLQLIKKSETPKG